MTPPLYFVFRVPPERGATSFQFFPNFSKKYPFLLHRLRSSNIDSEEFHPARRVHDCGAGEIRVKVVPAGGDLRLGCVKFQREIHYLISPRSASRPSPHTSGLRARVTSSKYAQSFRDQGKQAATLMIAPWIPIAKEEGREGLPV